MSDPLPGLAGSAALWLPLLYACGMLLVGVGLLILEFFVVSFGLISLAALASVGFAIYFAFQAGELPGWAFVVATPLLAVWITRWGIERVRKSSVVPRAEVTADAGYRHLADDLGVAPGSVGELVTPARPSGRARFPGGQCDVQLRGPLLGPGAKIVVERIDGPIIFVVAAGDDAPPTTPTSSQPET